MFIIVALASVIVVFSLVSAKALLGESAYQHKALKAKNDAVKKLKDNISAAEALKKQYEAFEAQNPNIIGGKGGLAIAEAIATQGEQTGSIAVDGQVVALTGQDGDNAKIVLDALPNTYDFPALISSIEKIANQGHIPLQGVGGTDQGQQPTDGSAPAQAEAQAINFTVSAETDYRTIQVLLNDLERSIRPIDVTQFALNGSGDNLTASLQATTFWQAPISLKITEKEVQ
jgi:hypothetical protein